MCVGGEGVRAAEEIGQGSPFSYLACILYRGEETPVGRADPAPQQAEEILGGVAGSAGLQRFQPQERGGRHWAISAGGDELSPCRHSPGSVRFSCDAICHSQLCDRVWGSEIKREKLDGLRNTSTKLV